jgi:hypothetical protein
VQASVAWEAFGEKNGAASYEEMCEPYYPLSGNRIWLPGQDEDQPGREFLGWHADTVYRR